MKKILAGLPARRLVLPFGIAFASLLLLLPVVSKAQEGVSPATVDAGIAAFEAGDFEKAAGVFGTLAQGEDAAAKADGMFYLGRMLEVGAGLPRPNVAAALAQYAAAAEAGSLRARNRMGLLYVSGSGVLQDFGEAAKHLKLAAEGGLADGQYNYGAMFQNGLGVQEDRAQALSWYGKAAAQGHLAANAILGEAYYNGEGVEKNLKRSYDYHLVAALRGAPFSQYRVGEFLRAGEVVQPDRVQAHMYLNLAAAAGVAEAAQAREALNAEMSVEDVLKAQQMAREWKPQTANEQAK